MNKIEDGIRRLLLIPVVFDLWSLQDSTFSLALLIMHEHWSRSFRYLECAGDHQFYLSKNLTFPENSQIP